MRSVSWTSTSRNKAPPRRPPGATNRDPVAAHIVRHKTADPPRIRREPAAPCATKPRGMRSGRPGAFLAQGTAMANNVRRYGLSRLQASRSPFAPASAFRNKAPAL